MIYVVASINLGGVGTNMEKVTYLYPKHMRYGAQAILFVKKEQKQWQNEPSYWLGVASGEPKSYKNGKGIPYMSAYKYVSITTITKEFYSASLKESAHNRFVFRRR